LAPLARACGRHSKFEVPSFAQISLSFPTTEEQTAIAAVLRTADEEIVHLEAELAALEKQKRGLMQKLLTGAVRVKV
jgi:type I restriction enzyme, S subunit